jgi:hypothetical protein
MDNRKKAFAIQLLRRGTYKWSTRWAAEKRSRVGRGEYFCEECGVIHRKKDTELDHVLPVVDPERGFVGFDEYIDRMFPTDQWGWKRLCIPCHETKTNIENEIRRDTKKKLDKA